MAYGCPSDDGGDLDSGTATDGGVRDSDSDFDAQPRDGGSPMDGAAPSDGGTENDAEPGDTNQATDADQPTDGTTDADRINDTGVPIDSGPIPCVPATCAGSGPLACGDCMDNDEDGLIDSLDPDCVGACDNNEGGYLLMIPGSETPNCDLDCYFDDNQGSGNDGCTWSSFCDPENRDGRTRPPDCRPHDPTLLDAGTCPNTQSADCHTNCDPLTPNGCDCFGCCELPARSGTYVFLGGTPLNDAPGCSAATLNNRDSCHLCTPTPDCLNTCGRCEVCLGSTVDDLPCDCLHRGQPTGALRPAAH